ncbi:THAP domain [Popillia japonica]|uniref:THAP domain n=1 Tax=Popillia japonica TaxID=7064 RepID=A0AAW1KIY6_POPJA
MDKCLVYGCPTKVADNDPTVKYYYFPKHPVLAQQWLNSCCIWNAEEIDLDSVKICSLHFDESSYTTDYETIDYVHYDRVLKYDALPTQYLPQPIVYRVTTIEDESFREQHYETTSVIIENTQIQPAEEIEETILKYEGLQTVAIQNEEEQIEEDIVEEKYKKIKSYNQLDEIKKRNDKMQRDLIKLERVVNNLKIRLRAKKEECNKQNVEYNKLLKTLSSLELKSMSVSEQKNLLSKVFSESQIKILSGKKKIYWSHDDMAIGYTIRHMSSKRCYMYLTKKLNIPLPGLSSIKRWQAMKKNELSVEEKESDEFKKEYSEEMN